jgi:hypothetical protein
LPPTPDEVGLVLLFHCGPSKKPVVAWVGSTPQ